jgi:two-component system cell cycle sensor histidine kinase PleC
MSAFGQAENILNRHHRGTGLGLPLVKSLAEAHGGSFALESEIGVGTLATVTLPASRVLRYRGDYPQAAT